MRYLLSILSMAIILLFGSMISSRDFALFNQQKVWAATPFDTVIQTGHNLVPPRGLRESSKVCLTCHTDGPPFLGEASLPFYPEQEAGEIPQEHSSLAGADMTPQWNPGKRGERFPLINNRWFIENTEDRKPFGSSSACLGCHDGALAADVHGEGRDLGLDLEEEGDRRPLNHPSSIIYPRRPNGIFVNERPTPASRMYWSIANRTDEGISLPSGPVSSYFTNPAGNKSADFSEDAGVVRTSYGMIHCDSCHNPHVNQHLPFLRTAPQDLCFVCHNR